MIPRNFQVSRRSPTLNFRSRCCTVSAVYRYTGGRLAGKVCCQCPPPNRPKPSHATLNRMVTLPPWTLPSSETDDVQWIGASLWWAICHLKAARPSMLSIHPTDHTVAAIIAIFSSLIGRFGQAAIGPDPQEWKRLVNGPSLEYNQRRHRSSGGRPWTEARIEVF